MVDLHDKNQILLTSYKIWNYSHSPISYTYDQPYIRTLMYVLLHTTTNVAGYYDLNVEKQSSLL